MLDKTPSDYQDRMHELLDRVLEAGSQTEAQARFEEASDELEEKVRPPSRPWKKGFWMPTAANALPEKYRERLRTTNMLERLIQEIRRREKVIRIFPNKASAWRLVGALLAEKHEEWSTGRRYWTMEEFYEWRTKEPERDAEELKSESLNPTLQPA